jgi:hypothetical protein
MGGASRWRLVWTVLVILLVPFGWLYPVLSSGWSAMMRRG